jgi:uncharacterized protein DUF4398
MIAHVRNCSFVVATIFCVGCSGPAVRTPDLCFWCTERAPTNRVSQADVAIRAAVEAKAADFAPVELQSARDKLAQARRMMTAEKYTEARRFAESAQVDAELAEAKAETAVMRRAADQILRRGDAPPTEAERESRKPLASQPD